MTTAGPGGTKRCPECGKGELKDVLFLEGSTEGAGEEIQESDTRQVEVYSCGHEVVGPRLDQAAHTTDELEVERRQSDETVPSPQELPGT